MSKSLDEICDELNRGRREIHKNLEEIEGWPDRVMRAILAPLKEADIEQLPRGKNIPQFGTKNGSMI